jgi:hypothetical protein
MIQIEIKYKDISLSEKAYDCPITIALRRHFKNKNISVSRNYIRVPKANKHSKDKWHLIELPNIAQEFLLNYDQNRKIDPFIFWLDEGSAGKLIRK